MGKNILYKVEGLPDWVSIANTLRSEWGWEPVYWLGPDAIRDSVEDQFPSVTFHEGIDASIGVAPIEDQDWGGHVLDERILERYQKYSDTILRMMDRFDPGYAFNYDERVRHYHRLLKYWLNVINDYSIDVAVFYKSPVQPHQYVIYSICKENDIDTPIITPTKIPDLWYVRGDVYRPNHHLCELTSRLQADRIEISEKSLAYLDGVSKGHAKMTLRRSDARFSSKLKNVRKYPRYVRKLPQRAGATHKTRGTLVEKSHVTWFRYLLQKFKAAPYKRRLNQHYVNLCTDVDLSENFVYVPLHYQPEKTTVPDGGAFCSQFLVIDLLSRVVPEDWLIYVKEHPSQFSNERIGERARATYVYDDIHSIDSVHLVEPSASSVDLIDNARVVSTVTGTAGWEAVVGGTPAIIFGNAWYRCCDGVYHVKTKEELEAAVEEIRDGLTVSREDVLIFVTALESVGYWGYNWLRSDVSELSFSENVKNTSEALASFVEG